ncbi:MAG: hypothetical protein KC519_12545, partial [Anaerolineae bacterium]|nr:hypothetical protein [Anaerolineae bacterium]
MDKNSWLSSILMALALVVVLGLASFTCFLIAMAISLETNNDTAFLAVWSLDELQENFIGPLPEDATEIEYEEGPVYALLTFQASPSSVDSFVRLFCYDMLYSGFDPFNSIDELLDDQG